MIYIEELVPPISKYCIVASLDRTSFTKILIRSLEPHKNIPPRIAVNMNNRNSVIAISVYSMYSTDRVIHRVEHSKIRN